MLRGTLSAFVLLVCVACDSPSRELEQVASTSSSDGESLQCDLPVSELGPSELPGSIDVRLSNTSEQVLHLDEGGCGTFLFAIEDLDLGASPTCRPTCDDVTASPELACTPCEAVAECTPTSGWVASLAAGETIQARLDGWRVEQHPLSDVECLSDACGEEQQLWDVCTTLHPIPDGTYTMRLQAWTNVVCCPSGEASSEEPCRAVNASTACTLDERPTGAGDIVWLSGTFSYPADTAVTLAPAI